MNKKGGMDTWQLVLMVLAILGLMVGFTYAAKTNSITKTIKGTVDKWGKYKNTKNLFTIKTSQINDHILLEWTRPKAMTDIDKYYIYVTMEDLDDISSLSHFTHSNGLCTGPDDNRVCSFLVPQYYSGESLVDLESGRYNVLIESFADDKSKGISRTVLNYVKRNG